MAPVATEDSRLAATAATAFRFLDLPRELRNMIYHEMIKHLRSVSNPSNLQVNLRVRGQTGLASALVPFLQTCSQINDELVSLIYSHRLHLCTSFDDWNDPPAQWLLPTQWLSAIPVHRLVRLELDIDGRQPLTEPDKAVRLLHARAPNLQDLTIRLINLDEVDWSWMDPIGEDVPRWGWGVDRKKQADNQKRFFGGRLIAAVKRMTDLELGILRVGPVDDERWERAVCRELGIEVEVQIIDCEPEVPQTVLYKPTELDGEVEGFHLEEVNLEEDVEYETGWENY